MPTSSPAPDPAAPATPESDPYAATRISQQPRFQQPPPGAWPPSSAANFAPPAGGFSPPQPGSDVPPAPGAPVYLEKPPRKRRTGLIVLISLLVVVIGGAAAAFFTLGPGSSLFAPTCSLSGFTAYNSPDKTFCVAYPTGWQVAPALQGSGARFSGPSNQLFSVSNVGAISGTPTSYAVAACRSLLGRVGQTTTVTLSGQTWTQMSCTINGSLGRVIIESVIYKGDLYHMDYGSSTATFASNQSQFFTPMEQSFRFLT